MIMKNDTVRSEKYMQICERIKKLRKEKGLSQAECTSLLGQKSSFMSKIETGTSILTVPILIKLAEILNCSVDSILFGSENENLSPKEQQLLNNYRQLPDGFRTALLIYSDFCCCEAEWDTYGDLLHKTNKEDIVRDCGTENVRRKNCT